MRTPGERLYDALREASQTPTSTILWHDLAPVSRSKYERAAAMLGLVLPSGQAVYEAWRKRADTSGRVIIPWDALPSDQQRIWDGVAKDLLEAKAPRETGWYWVKLTRGVFPAFIARWCGDNVFTDGPMRYNESEVEVLAGPLEPPNGAG